MLLPGESPASSLTVRCSELLRYARDPRLRLFAIGITILSYAVALGSFTLSMDGELWAYEPEPWQWLIRGGRWSGGLLIYVFPPLYYLPFLPRAMFCGGLVIAALLLAGCYARSRAEAFAFVAFFVSCPIWLHIAEFNGYCWVFAAGLCLAAGSIALLHLGGYRAAITAAIATTVATGIYQSLLLLVVCGSLLSVSLRLFGGDRSEPPSLKGILDQLAPLTMSWSIAVLLYVGATALILALSHQSLWYVDSYMRLTEFTSAATSSVAIDRTIRRLIGLFIGTDPTFLRWRWGIVSLLPAWLGAFAAIIGTLQASAERVRIKLLAAILVLGSALGAAAPVIVSAGIVPIRSLVALPVLYAAGAASTVKHNLLGKVPQCVIFSFSLFINVWISATLFNADAIARDRDRIMAGQLAERIAALAGFERQQPRQLILVGQWTHEIGGPAVRVEAFGGSFFEFDGGNPWRVEHYLRLLGIEGLRGALITHARDDIAEIENLPSWPAIGSVALVRDKLVIKLGPLSDPQRAVLVDIPAEWRTFCRGVDAARCEYDNRLQSGQRR
jgi:hypothetical protein